MFGTWSLSRRTIINSNVISLAVACALGACGERKAAPPATEPPPPQPATPNAAPDTPSSATTATATGAPAEELSKLVGPYTREELAFDDAPATQHVEVRNADSKFSVRLWDVYPDGRSGDVREIAASTVAQGLAVELACTDIPEGGTLKDAKESKRNVYLSGLPASAALPSGGIKFAPIDDPKETCMFTPAYEMGFGEFPRKTPQ